MAGYRKHQQNQEERCAPCKAASAAYKREQVSRNLDREHAMRKRNRATPAYQAARKIRHRKANHKRRALSLGVESAEWTEEEVISLYGTVCAICETDIDLALNRAHGQAEWEWSFTTDHWIPMTKGGTNTLENVRPAHAICNLKKGNKLPFIKREQCGTHAGWQSHNGLGELPCMLCRDARNVWKATHYSKHPQKRAAYSKKYRETHPDQLRQVKRRRRANLAEVDTEKYTEKEVLEFYGSNCHICELPIDMEVSRRPGIGEYWELGLHIDHLVPISKGGGDTLENVRPSHAKCNLRKSHRDMPEKATVLDI
jgi:5-methylcytosine-specific restriction endonuclease McrA